MVFICILHLKMVVLTGFCWDCATACIQLKILIGTKIGIYG